MRFTRGLKKAIVTVCPGGRQRKILDIVWPTWKVFSKRFGIPIIVIERPVHPQHVFWSKYFLFEMRELNGFDAILHLDNDIFISSTSSSPFEEWNPDLIGVVDERAQQSLNEVTTRRYYHSYGISDSAIPSGAKIYNMGFLIYSRPTAPYFKTIYTRWQDFLRDTINTRRSHYLFNIADQPHVSLALQREKMACELDPRFNTLWWHWYKNNVSARYLPFLLRSKAAAVTVDRLPPRVWRTIFRRERAIFKAARDRCDFLHVAGSKSPLFLAAYSDAPCR